MIISTEFLLLALIQSFGTYTLSIMLKYFNGNIVKNKISELILYIVAYFINLASIIFVNVPNIALLTHFLLFFLLSFNYRSTIWTKVKATFYTILISFIAETAVVVIVKINPIISTEANKDTLHLFLSAIIIEYVTITYISYCKSQTSPQMKTNFKVYILLMLLVVFVYLNMIFQFGSMPGNKVFSGFLVLLYVLSSVIFLYVKNYKEKKLLIEQRNHSMYRYEVARNAAHMLASIHGNINSHIRVIKSMIENDQKQDLLKYLDDMSDDIMVEELINTGNRDLDNILNLKISEASQKGIMVLPDIILADKTKINGYVMANILSSLFNVIIDELQGTKTKTLYFFIDSSMGPIQMWFKHADEMGTEFRKENKYQYRDTFKMERVNEEVEKYHGVLDVNVIDQTVETFVQVIF